MSNVTPLPTARQSDAGHQSRPVISNPVATLVADIDKALGDNWSFDLVHHEVEGDETVVLAKLSVDGRYRVAFGGTTETGSLVHRLNTATVDALARAAEWMGVPVPGQDEHAPAARTSRPASPAPASAPADQPRLSRKQLDFIGALGRSLRLTREQVAGRCVEMFGRRPDQLTKSEASRLIELMKKEATP
jgi:hypothetical protein